MVSTGPARLPFIAVPMGYAAEVFRKRFLRRPRRWLHRGLRRLRDLLRPSDYGALSKRVTRLERSQLATLASLHPALRAKSDPRAALRAHEVRALTENGEAGLLLHLFERVGVGDRRLIEFGIGRPEQCNANPFVLGLGWQALMIDADPARVEGARGYYAGALGDEASRVRLVQRALTPGNVDETFARNGYTGEIDLLSVDIDGNDYWVWQAIDVVSPRIAVVEYNASLGPERALVAHYRERFDRHREHPLGWYHGASLAAMAALARRKGYRLVGCESSGHNAFFAREDVADAHLEPLAVAAAFYPDARRSRRFRPEEQRDRLLELPWIEESAAAGGLPEPRGH